MNLLARTNICRGLTLLALLGLGWTTTLAARGVFSILANGPTPAGAPPVIILQPASQTVTNGANVTIGVGAGGAGLTYEWLFDGVPLLARNIITTVAGDNGLGAGDSGDGGAATNAAFNYVAGITLDGAGNLYVADTFNFVIRKVNAGGIISTVAGNNLLGAGYSGDGGPATNAMLNYPNAVVADGAGNLYIADTHNNVIRKVDAHGVITTVAGNASLGAGYAGDGGPATNAMLNFPVGLALDRAGNLYVADYQNNVIRQVDANGNITTVAGNFLLGGSYAGDGGPATNAGLSLPADVAVDGAHNLFISENGHQVVRRVDASGTITTVAGNTGLGAGFAGDGGAATNAALIWPNAMVEDPAGYLYIADYGNNAVRQVTPGGIITTLAGNPGLGGGYSGDGGAATNATLNNPVGLVLDSTGNLLIGDTHNNVIRKVCPVGVNVSPTNGALTISDVQASQAGNYQVIISGPDGSITSSVARLVVYATPVIMAQPAGQTVVEGGSVTLSVTATGTPPLTYQWRLNGLNIPGATSASLTVTNIHSSQAGDYVVNISTPDGSITSSNARVTVIPETILVYNFSGQQNYVAGSQSSAGTCSGELIFRPGVTNGTFIGWGRVSGQKRYWVNDFGGYTLYHVAGAGNASSTVLAQAGQGLDAGGNPSFWSAVYQGQNTSLPIGPRITFTFPSTLTGMVTEVYADPNTGKLVLFDSTGSYAFAGPATLTANLAGQTPLDLVNALIKSLTAKGYQN